MITDHTKETFVASPDKLHFAVWQLEEAPTTGKKHVQAYIVFTQDRTIKTMQKLYPGAHIEKARSSCAACVKYCQKEETRVSGPYLIGKMPEKATEKRSEYTKLIAYSEGSVCAPDIIGRIIRYYLEKGLCEPPEQRIRTIAVSILQHNTYKTDPIAMKALETARAQRIAISILERPTDYLPYKNAYDREQAEAFNPRCSTPESESSFNRRTSI